MIAVEPHGGHRATRAPAHRPVTDKQASGSAPGDGETYPAGNEGA